MHTWPTATVEQGGLIGPVRHYSRQSIAAAQLGPRLLQTIALTLLLSAHLVACGGDESTGNAPPPDTGGSGADAGVVGSDSTSAPDTSATPTIAVLGGGTHAPESVNIETIADSKDGLSGPTDLAFHSKRADELWITNQEDNAMIIVWNPGTAERRSTKASALGSEHFLAQPAALAFGENGNLATIHETDVKTQASTPADFMGPTLWSSDMAIFDGGHHGHLDMLHNSPNGMGIAWDQGNAYWVFDGAHSSLTHYDFKTDHGPGGSDHSDGVVTRYAQGHVKRVPRVPSHMQFHHERSLLYVADTGNNRVISFDITGAQPAGAVAPNYDGIQQTRANGGILTPVVDGTAFELQQPSGLHIHEDTLYIGDNQTGRITGFTLEGERIDWLDTNLPAGALKGLTFDPDGRLCVVDSEGNRVLRISSK